MAARKAGLAELGRECAVLFVSNHVSWADILVIGSLAPVADVAKREVADWPLVGMTARLQRTVFVDRAHHHRTSDAIAENVKHLACGRPNEWRSFLQGKAI